MSKRGSGGGSNVVLTYENIQITEDDLDCLKTHQFLNDKIINFFLIYLHRTLLNDEQREKVHIFDSFFSEALEHMDQQRVERWLRRVNVFEKDYLLVPALIDEHWFLIIICHPVNITKPATGRATTTNNNNSIHESPRRKRSRIVILDSMPDHARLKKPHLIEYLYNFFRIACVTQKNMSRSEIGNLSQRMQNFESEVIAQVIYPNFDFISSNLLKIISNFNSNFVYFITFI